MKTFYECVMGDLERQFEAGKIDAATLKRLAGELKERLEGMAKINPDDPIVQMPKWH